MLYLTFNSKKFYSIKRQLLLGGNVRNSLKLKIGILISLVFFSNFHLVINNNPPRIETTNRNEDYLHEPNSDVSKWLLMVYLDGDNEFELSAVDALNEFESGYSQTSKVDVIIMIDRIPDYDRSAGDWTNARYYHLLPDNDPMTIGSKLLMELGEVNMGDGSTLRQFVHWTQGRFSAERQALIIFNHGKGLSGISWDYSSNRDYITPNELQNAMNGLHVDLVVAEACSMGFLEIAYEWRSFTDYFASSQNQMLIESLNYQAVIEELIANPSMQPWELGEVFGRTYMEVYTYCTFQTFSVINCTSLPTLVDSLTNLSVELSNLLPSESKNISNIRQSIEGLSNSVVDLGTMINTMKTEFYENQKILSILNELDAEYSNSVLHNFNSRSSREKTGLEIFFPIDNQSLSYWEQYVNDSLIGDLNDLDFLNDTQWDDFLTNYLQSAPIIPSEIHDIYFLRMNRKYNLGLNGKQRSVFVFQADMKGIYNFTIEVTSGDIGFYLENGFSSETFETDFMYSNVVNPEQGNIEQIIHWFNPGICYIFISSLGNATGILEISLSRTKTIEVNQEITGEFPPAVGLIPPKTVHNYYSIFLEPGNYTLMINSSWPVGLEVSVINQQNRLIVDFLYGIPGENYTYQINLVEDHLYVFGFGSYTGTGSFSFIILMDTPTDRISFYMVILPITLCIITTIFLLSKKKSKE